MTNEQAELSRLLRDAAIALEYLKADPSFVSDLHRARIMVETLYVRIETLEEEIRQFKLNFWN